MGEPHDPNERDEFLISQLVDGTLDDRTRALIENRLRTDDDLSGLAERHRAVDALIRQCAAEARPVTLLGSRGERCLSFLLSDIIPETGLESLTRAGPAVRDSWALAAEKRA